MRSIGASSRPSMPPCSRSAANSRFTPSTAASSSVTQSTPDASSPSSESRSRPKWKSTKTVSVNSAIAGTDSRVRSSISRSLRRIARAVRITGRAPAPAGVGRPANSCRPPRGRAPRRTRRAPPSTSCVTSTRVRPERPADQRLEQLGRGGVEAGARLVEQQQRRVVQHRPRGGEALHHAARELAHRLVGAALHAHAASSSSTRARRHAVQARVEAQVLAPAELAVEQRLVAQVADRPRAASSARPAARRRARARCRRAGAAGRRAPAAAWSCRRRWRPSTASVWPSSTRTLTPASAARSP